MTSKQRWTRSGKSGRFGRRALVALSTVTIVVTSDLVPLEADTNLRATLSSVANAQSRPSFESGGGVGSIEDDYWTTSFLVKTPEGSGGILDGMILRSAGSDAAFPTEGTYKIFTRLGGVGKPETEVASVTGAGRKDQAGRAILEFRLPQAIEVKPAETFIIRYYGSDYKDLPRGRNNSFEVFWPSAPTPTVTLGTKPDGDPDLLANGARENCVIVENKGLNTGMTTWIAESFYETETGSPTKKEDYASVSSVGKPRNQKRNYTVLQYRVDGVEGPGAFQPVGGRGISPWVYNAVAYNHRDGYIYAVSQDRPQNGDNSGEGNWTKRDTRYDAGYLLRISPETGDAVALAKIDGIQNDRDIKTGFTNGTFDGQGNYIFANNSQNGTGTVYVIPFGEKASDGFSSPSISNGKVNAARFGLKDQNGNFFEKPWRANDWAYAGTNPNTPFVWSINSENGQRFLYRTDTRDGTTLYWNVTNLSTPSGEKLADGIYGNAWTYPDGDLGFSVNNAGIAYRIRIQNPDAPTNEAKPENPNPEQIAKQTKISLVSTERVPTSYNNDATTNAITVREYKKQSVDLAVEKKLQKVGDGFQWTITVENKSGCASSGFSLRDIISENLTVTAATPLTSGWLNQSRSGGSLNWTHGPLREGEKAILRVDTTPDPGTKCVANKVSIIGNEPDGDESNNVAYDGECDPELTIKKYITRDGKDIDAQDVDPAVEIGKGETLNLKYVVTNTGGGTVTGIKLSDVSSGDEAKRMGKDIQDALDVKPPFDLGPGATQTITITAKGPDAYAAFHRNVATAKGMFDPKDITFPKFDGGMGEVGFDPFDKQPQPREVVSNEDEANAKTPIRVLIEKRINGRAAAVVKPGENIEIWYRVTNDGLVDLTDVSIVDLVKEGGDLQGKIEGALKTQLDNEGKFTLAAGEVKDIRISVPAPAVLHTNVAHPSVPTQTVDGPPVPVTTKMSTVETTVPGTTISAQNLPEVTADGTTYPATVIPGTTIAPRPGTRVTPVTTESSPRKQTFALTTTPSATAQATPVNLAIKKEIQGSDGQWYDGEANDPAAPVAPGEDMIVRYIVTNSGKVDLTEVSIVDNVTSLEGGDAQSLTDQLNGKLSQVKPVPTLKAGATTTVSVTVPAPASAHVNVAKATAPGVTLPATTVPAVTVPPVTKTNTTVPGSVVPETVVPETVVTPPTPSNQAKSTPTTVAPSVQQDPEFKVQKTRAKAGNLSLTRNADGNYAYSAEYTIRVTNSGAVDGTHAQVWDAPIRGVGFTVDTVTVDGTGVEPQSGRYLISNGAEVKAGEAKDYKVVVSGTVTEAAANALPAAVGQCEAVTPENPGAGSGLVNTVSMTGDADGPENNIVCAPVELRSLKIEKRIDGRPEAVVKPGQPMEIWYRIYNTGNVTLTGVTLADRITEDNPALQKQIDEAIAKVEPMIIEPGAYEDVRISVTAPKGEHTNVAEARIPETTATATASAKSPSITIKKYINGHDDGTPVNPGEDMEILYRVTNTGSLRLDGIRVVDQVTQAGTDATKRALQRDINAKLAEIAPFGLAPGEVRDIRITVAAPAGGHVNEAKVSVPPVTIPATTLPGTTVPATVVTVTAPPDEGRSDSPQLDVKKFINNRDEGDVVTAGEDMTITYRVTNTGLFPVTGIRLADEVTDGSDIAGLEEALAAIKAFDLAPGAFRDETIKVKAPAGGHVNVARPVVPPVTVPGTTIPPVTVPPVTLPNTTVPATTIPSSEVPPRTITPTTTPSDDARSNEVKLEILKDIFSDADKKWHAADTAADAAIVGAGEQMRIRYTVTNTGTLTVKRIDIVDEVTTLEGADDATKQALTEALNTALAAEGRGFTLRPNETKTVEISVDAPLSGHVNVAKATAPAVTTMPGSTIPGTTVPGTEKNGTTIPGTTAPEIVVPPKTVTPNTPSNTAQATPTSSVPPVVDPQFVVEKFNSGRAGIALSRNADGKYAYSAEYTIRVRNSGLVDGTHSQIWDAPIRGVGFDITSVTVDGTEVQPQSGRYLVSDSANLATGQYKDFRVVVNGTVTDEAANALPAAVGQCEAVTPGNPGAGSGLVNVVTMSGDDDGIENNIVCEPVELRRLNIEKRIDGRTNAPVTPGQNMEIWYRVRNTGNVTLSGITLADQIREENPELQDEIDRNLVAAVEALGGPLTLEPGQFQDVKFTVTAPEGEHVNEVRAEVPPVTVPETTRPGTTIPGTTGPSTTVPPVTIPETTIPGTTEPGITVSTTAQAGSPKLSVKKFINGRDEHAVVKPGEDMVITYRLTNEGAVRIDGIRLTDEVKEDNADLQRRIDAQLGKVAPIALEPGESRDVTVTVPAPTGRHDDTVNVTVPPVTIPGTTVPGTTNNTTTVPAITVPSTVVTVTAPPDDAATDSVELKIKKYIRGVDGVWRDAEEEQDAAPVNADGTMDLRYVITNTGSLPLNDVVLTDTVAEMEGQQELQDAINAALEAKLAEEHPYGINLEPDQEITIELEGVKAPKVAHTNVAKVSAPPVVTEETVVSSIPGTTEPGTTSPDTTIPGTTVPGTVITETTQVTITPNEPEDKAQSTPTTRQTPPPPVTTTVAPERPQFAVEKLGARAGNVALTRNEEGSYDYSNEYVIRVRNSGLVDGEHATIWDVPLRGAGFTVNEVTVDDKAVEVENGRYKVADAAALKAGKYKDFHVTVTGTLAEAAANNLPEAVGQCTAEGANPGADSGLVNVANMNGDSDGPGNNVVCTPVELRRLNIEKRINGREDASVTPGEKMEIWYRVTNTGNVELNDIALADQIREDDPELQEEINAELAEKAKPFNLAPGTFQDIRIEVTAPEGEHVNEARAEVPPVTVPETTRPGTTIPGTTGPSTSVPPVTIPGTTLPGTTRPGTTVSTTARANSPLLEVKKFINGRDEHALVNAGEDMDITYRVTNKGTLPIDGIRLTDEVKEDNAELQQAIDAQLGKVAPFALEPGESMDVTVTVKAPAGRHDNVAGVTVPPVTIPATTIPGTTNPHTTVPGTTVPSTVVTVTAPPDDASSDSPQLEILKEIKRADEGDDAWRDAETEGDALPIGEGETMELRYTVTNTGSVKLDGVDIVDNVTRLDGGDADEFTAEINKALESAGRGLSLEPGESVEIVIEVSAPAGYHVNEAIATAPPVTATETVVSSVPGTTNETTTVPGSFVTETTVVERTPNTPTNKAQSTPTTGVAPCDCEVKTTTIIPAPVTTTVSGEVTTVTPDPVTSEVTITETPEPVTSEVTTTETPEPIVTTVVQTQDPITVTRTTPVTTVQTVTPEPQTVVTTVEGPEVTTTPDVPGQVVVVVDDSGKTVTEVAPTPVDGYTPPVTATATYTLPPVVTETLPQITVTEVPTTLVTTKATVDEGTDILGRCVANAVRSPILYMVPLLLAGQVLGEVAAPYVNAVNEQFNRLSAEIQDEIRRKTPNFGYGRRGQENEQVAELRAKAEAANRMLQELAMRPDVQQYGQWAAIAAGVVVAGSVLYDWCSNEAGEAFTAIGPKKSTSIDEVRVGGSSLGGDRVTTVVPPVTNTPGRDETAEDAGEAAGEAGSEAGSADGSSAGSSEGSSN